jgi:NAD(P)-dependent dehydrogenase (short-subunit alcohol dehydrogenase family)
VAHAFAGAGMKLCIADLRQDRLAEAKAALEAKGAEVEAIALDVADRDAMHEAARRVVERFGKVHVAVANAGVGFVGRVRDASYDDWDWSGGVNLGGVVNVIQEFLPIIRAQGEGGHVVATASMGGLTPLAHGGVYSVQKSAVVAIMESLYLELAEEGIGASVICPGMTRTNIGETLKLRPAHFAEHGVKVTMPSGPPPAGWKSPMELAMDPMEVGQRVLAGMLAGDLYILTHNEFAEEISRQFESILACMPPAPPPPPEARGGAGVMFPIYKRVLDAKGR